MKKHIKITFWVIISIHIVACIANIAVKETLVGVLWGCMAAWVFACYKYSNIVSNYNTLTCDLMSQLKLFAKDLVESQKRERIAMTALTEMRKRANSAETISKTFNSGTAYISAPITGLPMEEVEKHFQSAVEYLVRLGFNTIINPLNNGLPKDASYDEHMQRDLELLSQCDFIYILKGWEQSKGCRMELEKAMSNGLTIMFEKQ